MSEKSPGPVRNDGAPSRVVEALIVSAIIALAASVWNLAKTTAVLSVAQQYQQKQIDKIDRRQDTLEGRITRGEPDALDKQ